MHKLSSMVRPELAHMVKELEKNHPAPTRADAEVALKLLNTLLDDVPLGNIPRTTALAVLMSSVLPEHQLPPMIHQVLASNDALRQIYQALRGDNYA